MQTPDKNHKLEIYNIQTILLVAVIILSFLSIYNINALKKNNIFNLNPKLTSKSKSIDTFIIWVTLIIFIIYWLVAFYEHENEKQHHYPNKTKKEVDLNILARTLILIAVMIDVYLNYVNNKQNK